jgi:hypothetical protein
VLLLLVIVKNKNNNHNKHNIAYVEFFFRTSGIEEALIKCNGKHFRHAHGTPPTTLSFKESIDCAVTTPTTEVILGAKSPFDDHPTVDHQALYGST